MRSHPQKLAPRDAGSYPHFVQRVLVIGSGGAGKSTIARQLASRLGLPLVHLDALYWRAGWQATPKDEWRERVEALIAEPRWVMDGNYSGTLDMRLARCDTVVFLDLPRVVCLWRIVKRQIQFRGRSRPDMSPNCPERLTWEFITWVWTYPSRRRGEILRKLAALDGHQRTVVLASRRDVRRFLDEPLPR
jgi:adenylate kinase family enzyme